MAEKEMIKIFDENMKEIGVASRCEAHKNGLWHQTFHCWIVRKEGDKNYLLFQKRGENKKDFPSILDITAAGHIMANEGIEDGIRELNEELGINVDFKLLIPLGIRPEFIKSPNMINREFCHTFMYRIDQNLLDYNIQEDELDGLVQIEIQDGLKLFSGEVDKINASGFQIKYSIKHPMNIEVSLYDIIPRHNRYYLKILIMAERYFENKKYLVV
jgi:isopentenyldiphosphate isomerase